MIGIVIARRFFLLVPLSLFIFSHRPIVPLLLWASLSSALFTPGPIHYIQSCVLRGSSCENARVVCVFVALFRLFAVLPAL